MNLAELQRAFQHHVLHAQASIDAGTNGIAAVVNATEHVSVATRLGIYADAYQLRLADALAYNFPCLQQLLGKEAFAALARDYLAAEPSRRISVRWFGHRFAEYLAAAPQDVQQPWIAELARWEWAIATAFDSPDDEPLDAADLGRVAPDDWPTLQFGFAACVQQVQTRTNVPALFKAFSDSIEAPLPAVLEQSQSWLIWRQDLVTRYRMLPPRETQALHTMREHGTFADLCEVLSQTSDIEEVPHIAAGFLQQWLAEGLISAIVKD